MTGVDLSPGFIDAATYLTARCGLSDRVTFQVGDALHLPFEEAAFDTVFLQHVAMNIEDRASLYAEVRRILATGGRFVTYDVVLRDGDVVYPDAVGARRLDQLSAGAKATRARRWNKPGSRRCSGATTPRSRSTGLNERWPARRRADRTSVS